MIRGFATFTWSATYIDAGRVGSSPKSALLKPVSVMYACIPSGENVIPVHVVSIGLVTLAFIGKRTVWGNEVISNNGQCSGLRVKTINLIAHSWYGTEMLPITIHCVREVDMTVPRIHRHVINGVELSTEIVIQKNCEVSISEVEFVCALERDLPVVL